MKSLKPVEGVAFCLASKTLANPEASESRSLHSLTKPGRSISSTRITVAAPMRIEVLRGGKTEEAAGQAHITAGKPTAVSTRADWQTAAVKGRTEMTMEYDGCAKVMLSFEPADNQPIDALRVVVPLSSREVPLMHAVGDGIRFNYAGQAPRGRQDPGQADNGRVWGSDKASRSHLLGTFLPYLWVGGESRGLCWFAGNDRDWVLDPAEKVPALPLSTGPSHCFMPARRMIPTSSPF